jgi:putative oxidoreductase
VVSPAAATEVRKDPLWLRSGELLLSVIFLCGGLAKLIAWPSMVTLFAAVGMGQWLRIAVGIAEVTGAVLMAWPSTSWLAAIELTGVLAGAIATNVFILHDSPLLPLATLAGVVGVLWCRRTCCRTNLARGLALLHRPRDEANVTSRP